MKTTLIILAVASLSSCTGLVQHSMFGSEEGGYVSINADAAGMQALGDWNAGLITEGKASPDIESAYYQLRKEQEKQKTFRIRLPKASKGGAQ